MKAARACALGALMAFCCGSGCTARSAEAVPSIPGECPAAGDEAATVVAVEPWLALRLADNRVLRLAGVEPVQATPGDPAWPATAGAWLAALTVGKAAHVRLIGTKPDRWGRSPAYVFVAGTGDGPGGIAATALAAGIGRWRAEPAAHGCRDVLRAAEATATAGSLGLWRDPYYAVIAAGDRTAFEGRSATIVVTEGQVTAVERGPFRTRLRFAGPGRAGRGALIATILPRVLKSIESGGVKLDTLVGRIVRLRGLLDLHFGPNLQLSDPDALVLLPAPGGK